MFTKRMCNVLCIGMLISVAMVATGYAQTAKELAAEQILRIGLAAADADKLDPHLNLGAQDVVVHRLIFNTLLQYKEVGVPSSGLKGCLAESWEVSEDGLVWTFYLRKGVQFHRGWGELTAEDVVFTFTRVKDKTHSVLGADIANIERTGAVDRYTVQFYLKKPFPLFGLLMAHSEKGHFILSKAATQYYDEQGDCAHNLIGTGPFMWDEYVPKSHLTLVRNPDYFEGEPLLEKVYYMPDTTSRTLAFLNGELDIIKGDITAAWVRALERAGYSVDYTVGFAGYLMFNMMVKPFGNRFVRLAFAYAIDVNEFKEVFGEGAEPQYSVVPETWINGTYEGMPRYDRNLEKAKQMLARAGYPEGFSFTAYTSERSYYRNQYEIIQAQLKEVGINMELEIVDHTSYWGRFRENPHTVHILGQGAFPDAMTILASFGSDDDILIGGNLLQIDSLTLFTV